MPVNHILMCNKQRLRVVYDSCFITARKRILGQGNDFTPVCQSVHGEMGYPSMKWGRGCVSQHTMGQGV